MIVKQIYKKLIFPETNPLRGRGGWLNPSEYILLPPMKSRYWAETENCRGDFQTKYEIFLCTDFSFYI
jgi:hypothetical protein